MLATTITCYQQLEYLDVVLFEFDTVGYCCWVWKAKGYCFIFFIRKEWLVSILCSWQAMHCSTSAKLLFKH